MDKILDIKLEEIEKEIKNFIVYYTKDDKRKKINYSVYNPNINEILEKIKSTLLSEKNELNKRNEKYKFWLLFSKVGIFFAFIYLILILFNFNIPALLSVLIFIILFSPSIIAMGVGDKKDIDRELQVDEFLKKIEKIDNFVKVKGINKVRVAQKQISKSIQYGADKTSRAVKNFASDIISVAMDEKEQKNQQVSAEKLKEFRRQIVSDIEKYNNNKGSEVDNSLDRLDNLVDSGQPMPRRKKEINEPSTPYEYDDLYEPDPEYTNRRRRR